jgi:hypothetical protein
MLCNDCADRSKVSVFGTQVKEKMKGLQKIKICV